MADNFDLRSFLTENKLTKNAQLLSENEGVPVQGLNLIVLDDNEGGEITLEKYSDMDDQFQQIFSDGLEEGEWEATSLEQGLAELDEYFEERGDPSQQEDYDAKKQQFQSVVQGKAGKFYVHNVEYDLQLMFIEGQEGEENLDEALFSDSYDTPAAKKVHGRLRDIVDIFQKSRNEEEQEVEAAITAAEQETGSQVTPTEKSVLLQQARWLRMRDTEMEREGTENKKPIMKETKLTAKERRLVEMVQKAMKENTDISTYTYEPGEEEDEYQDEFNPADAADEEDYRRDQYRGNQIPEGDDMVQEKPMPKYESIDQLMKEIEHGTNEAAHKYKMEEMKRIYELLETKVTSLEEGENAEHIDQSKVKQMRKDIAALRKAEEKLRKEFEKKFNKKEKPAAAPKAEKEAATEAASEALQEGTFDLRKFLAENRKK